MRSVDKHKTQKHYDFCPPQARKFCILEAFTRGICIKKQQNFRRLRRANYYGNYHDYCDYNQIICQNSSSAFIKRAKTVHKPPLVKSQISDKGGGGWPELALIQFSRVNSSQFSSFTVRNTASRGENCRFRVRRQYWQKRRDRPNPSVFSQKRKKN